MAYKLIFAAKTPLALKRARNEFVAEHTKDVVCVWGSADPCRIDLADGTKISMICETDWTRCRNAIDGCDQVFIVGAEPLGADFRLALERSLQGSSVPPEYRWHKWNRGGGCG